MSLAATCPECRTVIHVAVEHKGKKIRCKNCQTIFVAGAPPRRKDEDEPAEVEIVERPRPAPRPPAKVTAAKPVARKIARDDEDDEYDDTPRPRNNTPLIIGGALACLLVVVGGGVAMIMALRDSPSESKDKETASTTKPAPAQPTPPQPAVQQPVVQPPVNPPPVVPPVDPPKKDPDPPRTTPDPPKRDPDPPPEPGGARSGRLARGAIERVKRGTVLIKVVNADGSRASGTGFFGSAEARNLVLTNAHVVGMLAPDSRRPREVEVVINSGQSDERKVGARVLGVDRTSDLAVLDTGNTKDMPEPLTVKAADGLRELDPVYVFGFPLGERLGKEITIRDSSVSSLRKKYGRLDKVQVNGGMDPGNSGGPVVDADGHVVGVAVSGIPGRMINFCIPGDRVHAILNGRLSGMEIAAVPFLDDAGRVGIPVKMEMIDPRNRIKEAGLDVWIGDAPAGGKTATRPPATAQPADRPGDSGRKTIMLSYAGGTAAGDILFPGTYPLPGGKTYWIQPLWVDSAGKKHWAAARVYRLTTQPAERKPALLAVRYARSADRPVTVTYTATFRVAEDEDSEIGTMQTQVRFKERMLSGSTTGARVAMAYDKADRKIIINRRQRDSKLLPLVRRFSRNMVAIVDYDGLGNVRPNANVLNAASLARLPREVIQQLVEFHQPISAGLETLAVPLPNHDRELRPLEKWRTKRLMPVETPEGFEKAHADFVYTYLGRRKRDGREEAVIDVSGTVRGGRGKEDKLGGRARGTVLVDLATGQILTAKITVNLDMEIRVMEPGKSPEPLRVINTVTVRLERKL